MIDDLCSTGTLMIHCTKTKKIINHYIL